jgi:triosephosphate isomerase
MLIAANWKAYVETPAKAKALVAGAKRLALRTKHTIVLTPSYPHLGLCPNAGKKNLAFGAQDISLSEGGASTGEVTGKQLATLGAAYVIVGHSERRAMGESNEIVAKKAQQAISNKLVPILCVGERARDEDAKYLQELREQMSIVLKALAPKERGNIVVAYEPVWAIGRSAREAITPDDLAEMILYIRKLLGEHMPAKTAAKVRILYGGSVEPGNVRELAEGGKVDGFLIGHASVDVSTFAALVKAVS